MKDFKEKVKTSKSKGSKFKIELPVYVEKKKSLKQNKKSVKNE